MEKVFTYRGLDFEEDENEHVVYVTDPETCDRLRTTALNRINLLVSHGLKNAISIWGEEGREISYIRGESDDDVRRRSLATLLTPWSWPLRTTMPLKRYSAYGIIDFGSLKMSHTGVYVVFAEDERAVIETYATAENVIAAGWIVD